MVPDWETNAVFFAASLPHVLPGLWHRLAAALARNGVEPRLVGGTKDIWVRDFLPVQAAPRRFVKFRYEPDYLRGFGHLRTGEEVCERLSFLGNLRHSSLRLDGGNMVSSRQVVILTDKAYRENRTWSRPGFRAALRATLGVARCLVIPAEPGDCFGHADGVVRFLDERSVVVNDHSAQDPSYGRRLREILTRAGLRVEVLPYRPDTSVNDGVPSAVGNYLNFLQVGPLILVPAYGAPEDEPARRRLESLLPGAQVIPIPCAELAARGGVLHCASWTVRLSRTHRIFSKNKPPPRRQRSRFGGVRA